MKPAHLAILLAVLVLGIANLLAALGVIGGGGSDSSGGGDWEYRIVTPQEMDSVGFKAVAAEVGVEPDEEGKMKLPPEKLQKDVLLKTTLAELAKENWELSSVSLNGLYIFRRAN